MKCRLLSAFVALSALLVVGCSSKKVSSASSRDDLEASARSALSHLYETTPGSSSLASRASGILVFPSILEGGFVVSGAYGDGVLFEGGRATGFYNTASASFGLLAGVDKYGYALFLMSPEDLQYLKKSDGWELGVGPNVTLVDQGSAASYSSTTARRGIYAFFFNQRGLMAGISLKGAKISKMAS